MQDDLKKELKSTRVLKWTSWKKENYDLVKAESDRMGLPFTRIVELLCMEKLSK